MKYFIKTWGCQMNLHDSEKMAGILEEEGLSLTNEQKEADLIVFNTCSIRQKAEQKFLSELGKIKSLKRGRPSLRVAVAGCIAQHMADEIRKKAPYVDYVLGPQNIHLIRDIANGRVGMTAVEDNPEIAELELPVSRRQKGRAWVSIMFGCNNFCTYCVVPYTRGKERSRPVESILKEINGLVGFKEVTLLGQNVNSFRSEMDFPNLLRKINKIKGIERIRFVTSHPRDFSDGLISAMAELDKVCEHIHLPLQSGSTRILGLMNRGYTYEDYKGKVDRLRQSIPHIAVTSDIIAGFPTETASDHKHTVNALLEQEFDGIFAFKFSSRPGTKAASMEGQLPEAVKAGRLSEILYLQDEITLKKNKRLEGEVVEVLVEGISETDKDKLTGRTRTNKIVNFRGVSDLSIIGKLLNVRVLKAKKHSLEAEIIP